jgi:GDPmannose 4,6-dehydratase
MYVGNWYAEKYWLQVINAILYNHESEYRSPKFVSMKIIQWAINIKKGLQDSITLWDLSTQVDRWYAGDYVEAMRWSLQTYHKWDYIISSWKLHTIQDMVEIVFNYLDLDWKQYIQVDTTVVTRKRWKLFWDNNKIKKDVWRKPSIWFAQMLIRILKLYL